MPQYRFQSRWIIQEKKQKLIKNILEQRNESKMAHDDTLK